ncbi:putative enoyl-CoA hydratase echA8 [compost metagenome]
MYEHYRFLKFEYRGRCLLVTMDNPPVNAAHLELHNELSQVFYDVERDDACDLVVLTGAGRAFSAGGDLPGMLKACDDPSISASMIVRTPHIVRSMLAMEKPVIAMVNGHAMGLGATLALLADVAIMAEGAKIADPHVNVGLSAGDGGALLWPLLIGYARARHYLLTGEAIVAAEAAQIGLIHKAVPAEQLEGAVWAYAERLLALPKLAVRITKRSINMGLRQQAESLVDAHAGLEHLTIATQDHREAVQAFLEKRPPVFRGV